MAGVPSALLVGAFSVWTVAGAVGAPPVLVTMSSGAAGVLSALLLVEYCSSESCRSRSRRVLAYRIAALTCIAFLFSFSWWSVAVFLARACVLVATRACHLLAEVDEVIPT